MRKTVLLGAVLVLALGGAAASVAADATGPATLADALAQAKAQNRQLVLDFYADW
jgi:hypothetical protein